MRTDSAEFQMRGTDQWLVAAGMKPLAEMTLPIPVRTGGAEID